MANESRLVVIDGAKALQVVENSEIEQLYADFRAALARQKPQPKLPPIEEDEPE